MREVALRRQLGRGVRNFDDVDVAGAVIGIGSWDEDNGVAGIDVMLGKEAHLAEEWELTCDAVDEVVA